jgi:hypothetical protein
MADTDTGETGSDFGSSSDSYGQNYGGDTPGPTGSQGYGGLSAGDSSYGANTGEGNQGNPSYATGTAQQATAQQAIEELNKDGSAKAKEPFKATVPTVDGQDINAYMQRQAADPRLPAGTQINPALIQDGPGMTVADASTVLDPTGANQAQIYTATASTAKAPDTIDAAAYDAATLGKDVPQAEAAQGTMDTMATLQGQLSTLMAQFEDGQTPVWARGAMEAANATMAARGLGASSIAAASIVEAAMRSGVDVAKLDAQSYKELMLANLNNRQQTNLVNTQLRYQAMVSDASMVNAAKQFNATSENQVSMFNESLRSDIEKFNVQQVSAMAQFNAGQLNAAEQLNAQLRENRAQTYAKMQTEINQSNVQWRRQANMANTAMINAANETNALNLLGVQQTALNNIWQAYRDEAAWAWTSGENEQTRAYNMAIAAMDRDYASSVGTRNRQNALYGAAGSFAANLLDRIKIL